MSTGISILQLILLTQRTYKNRKHKFGQQNSGLERLTGFSLFRIAKRKATQILPIANQTFRYVMFQLLLEKPCLKFLFRKGAAIEVGNRKIVK